MSLESVRGQVNVIFNGKLEVTKSLKTLNKNQLLALAVWAKKQRIHGSALLLSAGFFFFEFAVSVDVNVPLLYHLLSRVLFYLTRKSTKPASGSNGKSTTWAPKWATLKSSPSTPHYHHSSSRGSSSLRHLASLAEPSVERYVFRTPLFSIVRYE